MIRSRNETISNLHEHLRSGAIEPPHRMVFVWKTVRKRLSDLFQGAKTAY